MSFRFVDFYSGGGVSVCNWMWMVQRSLRRHLRIKEVRGITWITHGPRQDP